MKHFVPNVLVQEFQFRSQAKLRRDLENDRQIERQKRTLKKEQDTQDEQLDAAFLMAIASAEDVALFRSDLNDLQQTAIERIIRLQTELDERATARQALLETAYILPDGRYVFPAEDGSAAFFENGTLVDPQIISPEQIGDENLTIDDLQAFDTETESVKSNLDAAITFHDKVEDFQSRSDKSELTNGELKAFQSELDALNIESLGMDNLKPDVMQSDTAEISEQAEVTIKPLGLPLN